MSQFQLENEEIVVSVAVTVYNQSKYIEEAINSILNQKVDFNYEIVICEDCSIDGTREICIDYFNRFPDKIRLFNNEKNLGYSKNFVNVLTKCRGEFIALCEGDDYWNDSNKLQYQVDFLKNNKEYSLCCHDYQIKDQFSGTFLVRNFSENRPLINVTNQGGSFDNRINLLEYWYTKTMTVMFRRKFLDIELLNNYNHFYDVHLYYHLLKHSNGFFLNGFCSATYRQHDSYHNGRDWIHRAEIAFLNDKELYNLNRKDTVIKELFKKTRKVYLESLKHTSYYNSINIQILRKWVILCFYNFKCTDFAFLIKTIIEIQRIIYKKLK